MINQDVIYQKINSIQNCLQRIHDTISGDVSRLNQLDAQDITVLNLQRAIQLVIDTGSHIIASYYLGVPQSLKEIFIILEQNKFIDHSISLNMQKMVGFRNIAVHDYQAIDPEILKSVVSRHLKDFEEFYTSILQKVKS